MLLVHPGDEATTVSCERRESADSSTVVFPQDAPEIHRCADSAPVGMLVPAWPGEVFDMSTITARRSAAAFVIAMLVPVAADAASYRVFPVPVASPDEGERLLVVDPEDNSASPFGWHDTNGAAGAEYTILRGNNAVVYTDVDNDDMPDGNGADGGPGLSFDFAWSPSDPPSLYREAFATNAFYWANMAHDIFWRHGFTEAAGNMQTNNYGRGGLGNDPLIVEIQDGGGLNDANGSAGADGNSPRIQLYLWNRTTPRRDASFDATMFLQAYGQVLNDRIVGPGCSANAETPSSGYNDFFALLLTTNFLLASPAQRRGIGTYVLGQPYTGAGIRGLPYMVSATQDLYTYDDTRTLEAPQGTGFVWASILWEATWGLVDEHGASYNWFNGNGAENAMLRLAIRAMQLQPCQSGFVDARNAWLAADAELNNSENTCLLWKGFARHGLGFSAIQGSAASNADNVAAYDLPVDCNDPIFGDNFDT
jgi:extracellular elastinolytic metalloproteinase